MNIDPKIMIDDIYSYGKPYSVKYSLHGEKAFSYDGKRGANSSRGRKLDPRVLSKSETLLRIKDFIKNAPTNCSGVILQEFIDQTGGCLFHAEFSSEAIQIDLLWENSTGRAYSLSSFNGDKSIYEGIKGLGNPSDRKAACEEITKRCRVYLNKLLKLYGNISWSLEGFWSPDDSQITVLQLRPTPQDRPISPVRNVQGAIYATNFTWGDYEIGPFKLTEENLENLKGVFVRKSPLIERIEIEVIDKLSVGNSVLLIDPFRGFCLSHEKWFLPPIGLRKTFSFIHIPKKVISDNLGRMVKIVSSGRRGYIVPVS